jgi:putative transposase
LRTIFVSKLPPPLADGFTHIVCDPMPEYRRAYVPGGTYFFTVKTFDRRPLLTDERSRTALRQAIVEVLAMLPFETIAWVLLPDHLHTVWRLPETDVDFSLRWSLIKQRVTKQCVNWVDRSQITPSRKKRHEGTFWQRRFWEHLIRDDADLESHVDYIHYNPVKHGYVHRVADWPYSTFHRYVNRGVDPLDWASAYEYAGDDFGE